MDEDGGRVRKRSMTPLRLRQASWIPSPSLSTSKSISFRRRTSGWKTLTLETKLVIAMVGLPGRGKSYTARKLARYLKWLHFRVRVFNFGDYRRKLLGSNKTSDFYDPDNHKSADQREQMAIIGIADVLTYLGQDDGEIGILDATNTTIRRRDYIREKIQKENGYDLIWIESICNDTSVLERSIREVKAKHPDYEGMDRDLAVKDFHRRIEQYKKRYVPLRDDEGSFVKMLDAGRAYVFSFSLFLPTHPLTYTQTLHTFHPNRMALNELSGPLQSRLASFLMNLRPLNKVALFATRHGESEFNALHRIGGDTQLTEHGVEFSKKLGDFCMTHKALNNPKERATIWYSSTVRCRQTAKNIRDQIKQRYPSCEPPLLVERRELREIDSGICDSMTYEEIRSQFPVEWEDRQRFKLEYRYPNGESYLDVIHRLEPVILDLERANGPILIIAHRALLRCLLGYFMDVKLEQVPFMHVPLHEVVELTHRRTGECDGIRHPIGRKDLTSAEYFAERKAEECERHDSF